MKKKKRIRLVASIVAVLAVGVIVGGFYYSGRIRNEVAGMLETYKEIDVDLLRRTIYVEDLLYKESETSLQASEVFLEGLDYWNYIINDRIIINKVEVRSPDFTFTSPEENKQDGRKDSRRRPIRIKDFQALDGIFRLKGRDSEENELFIRFSKFHLSKVKIDSTTQDKALPFKYSTYQIKGDSAAVKMNPQHFIAAEEFSLQNGRTSLKNFQIIPFKSRSAFDQSIPYEKDRISLKVKSIALDSLTFHFKNDTLHLNNPLMTISGATLDIYHNKLLRDDLRTKTLLSQKMRNSPIKFDLEKIKVTNSKIRYEEKLKEKGPLVTVSFSKIEGAVENLKNTHLEGKDPQQTSITADALFMDSSPVKMEWSFQVMNLKDEFLLSGYFESVEGNTLDPLLKPSLGLEAEGNMSAVFFTFTGNDDTATGDVKVSYDQFKLNVMQQEGKKENKFLSALANLFVDNDGLSEQRTHNVQVTRDKTRSFWNYIWEILKKGVIDALSQF